MVTKRVIIYFGNEKQKMKSTTAANASIFFRRKCTDGVKASEASIASFASGLIDRRDFALAIEVAATPTDKNGVIKAYKTSCFFAAR